MVDRLGKASEEDAAAFIQKLSSMMSTEITEASINEFGRFDDLKGCIGSAKAKDYFEALEGESISVFKVNMKADGLLSRFIISGGFDLE